jgi:hypothetical protein
MVILSSVLHQYIKNKIEVYHYSLCDINNVKYNIKNKNILIILPIVIISVYVIIYNTRFQEI